MLFDHLEKMCVCMFALCVSIRLFIREEEAAKCVKMDEHERFKEETCTQENVIRKKMNKLMITILSKQLKCSIIYWLSTRII